MHSQEMLQGAHRLQGGCQIKSQLQGRNVDPGNSSSAIWSKGLACCYFLLLSFFIIHETKTEASVVELQVCSCNIYHYYVIKDKSWEIDLHDFMICLCIPGNGRVFI